MYGNGCMVVVLGKIRSTLSLLRKERAWSENKGGYEGDSLIVEKLQANQTLLRHSGNRGSLETHKIVEPFLMMLKSRELPGPFKLVALDAIQAFITHDVLLEGGLQTQYALSEIIEALVGVKFTSLSSEQHDGMIPLQILHNIDCIINSATKLYLKDDMMWSIIKFVHEISIEAGIAGKSALYQSASHILEELLGLVFRQKKLLVDNGMKVDENSDGLLNGQLSTIVALKIVTFYMGILEQGASQDHTTSTSSTQDGRFSSNRGDKLNKNRISDTNSLEKETVEILLALKAIQTIILVDGNKGLRDARGGKLLLLSPVFSHYFRDDLGKCLVILAGKQRFPVAVMSGLLETFMAALSTFGPVLRVVVENFMRHVFLRALHQSLRLFGDQDIFLNGQNDSGFSDILSGGVTPTSREFSRETHMGTFSVPKLELVLENLVDLLSDFDFVPSLFASFDCDTTKNDVVQPMLRYLSRCVRYGFSNYRSGAYDLGPLTDLSTVCLSAYSALLSSLSDRCSLRDGSKDTVTSSKQVELVSQIYRAARVRKEVMAQAARIFSTRKPCDAFRFLQEHAILQVPAPSKDVAEFLRYTPGLNIEKVGSYLGELGKDDSMVSHECDGMEFHQAALADYIKLFDFRDLSILQAIRIFLSAFLLPKEAQQIERIFVALSEHCHRSCVECVSGAFENSDVTYLMTMSIIMLNTDRHNTNIRPDRKMTKEKFVKVNTHYGRDVNQTKAIDRDYLESIYDEIGIRPLRTEPDDLSSGITPEMWMEKQLQLKKNPEKGFMVGLSCAPEALKTMSETFCNTFDETEGALVAAADKGFISPHATAHALNPLALSACIVGHSWLFDSDYVSCIWPEILGVGICPFLMPRMPPYIPDRLQPEVWFSRESTPQILRAGIDVLMALLKAADTHSVRHVTDVVVAVLVEITGTTGYAVSDALFAKLKLDFHLSSSRSHDGTAASRNAAMARERSRNKYTGASAAIGFTKHLLSSLEARTALVTLLQVVQNTAGYVKDRWAVVWCLLGRLRDCTLLPPDMVCMENDDALPAIVRTDFEARLAAYELASQAKKQGRQSRNKRGILGFLFGSGDSLADKDTDTGVATRGGADSEKMDASLLKEGEVADPSYAQATRWDAGYLDLDLTSFGKSSATGPVAKPTDIVLDGPVSLERHSPELSGAPTEEGDALSHLRMLIASCGTERLVADSKFFSDDTLTGFVRALTAQSETPDVLESPAETPPPTPVNLPPDIGSQAGAETRSVQVPRDTAQSPTQCLPLSNDDIIGNILSADVPIPSPASASWQENVLVDIALRNRDRFSLLWPILREHYLRGLNSQKRLSYAVERRVAAIFKIAERMLSRESYSKPIIALLASLFVIPQTASFRGSIQSSADPMKPPLLKDVAGQISTGLWRVVTRNVESLPKLGMEQWQVIFDIIAFCAGAGSFASIKAFETMAWLLHEPRLRAEVPVFCVVGIRPLLCSAGVPKIISVGAVKLLMHLHMRLDILVKKDNTPGKEVESEKNVVWESCWTPVLSALAEGATDPREQVGHASAIALANALADRHASVVPSAVLWDILGNVVTPSALVVGEALVTVCKAKPMEKEEIKGAAADGRVEMTRDEEILFEVLKASSGSNAGSARPSFDEAALSSDDKLAPPPSPISSSSTTRVTTGSSDDADYPPAAPSPASSKSRSPLRQALMGNSLEVRSEGSTETSRSAISIDTPAAAVLIQTLCDVFVCHLDKLIKHPRFQHLWCERLLYLLGYFLEAAHGFNHDELLGPYPVSSAEAGENRDVERLRETVTASREALLAMLRGLVKGGHFRGAGKLWTVTQDTVSHFKRFEQEMKLVLKEAMTD